MWLPEEDTFTFKANPPEKDFPLTKRNFLMKIIKLLDWDDLFQEDLTSKARKWFSELEDLPTIKVTRCLHLGQEEEMLSQTLHTRDASQDAYGAEVYSKAMYKGGTVSKRLVAAKTKVAPFSTSSISRLELIAAVLGLRMTESISRVLSINLDQAVFWWDSTTPKRLTIG